MSVSKMYPKLSWILNSNPADPVAATKPLWGSLIPVTILLLSYLLFVLKIGKIFMKKRKAYDLKNILIAYNIFQVIYNGIMFYYIFKWVCIIRVYNFRCMETLPFDFSDKDLERNITYAYFINKIIDLLDTIFFILRKKYKQVTFLHVYHHIMMVYTVYWVIRLYGCGAQYCILALLNSFVHVVMYFYYLISALNTDMRGSLWWKKYITLIQIIQFTILWLQAFYMLVFRRDCPFPQYLQWMQLIQATLMITMFSKFYIKTYFKSGKSRVQKKRL